MTKILQDENSSGKYTDIFEERYYINNKRLMCFLGQWPYQSFPERCVRTMTLIILSFSLLVPQMLKLIDSWGHVNIFVETFSPLITNIGFNIKLANTILNTKKIKKLLDVTRENWERTRRAPETKILRVYGEKGRRLTIFYFTLINSSIAAWISTPMVPVLMDHFIPLNESRPSLILFQTDYKIDQEKYFYSIFLHGSFVCGVGMQMFVCHDTLYMALAQHSCAMLEILRHRLENIMPRKAAEEEIQLHPEPRDDVHYQKLVDCIKNHKCAIQNASNVRGYTPLNVPQLRKILSISILGRYIEFMESSCEWCLFVIIGLNMLVMSCTGSRTVAKETVTQDVIRFAFYTVAQVVHLFCITLPGQFVMNASSTIWEAAYNSTWYLMSVRSRKLIMLLLRQSAKPCTITAGKMYVMSLENFCAVLQTSMSYFTMLTSMQ